MDREYLEPLRDFYRKELLENILLFWLKNVRDQDCGGYHTCLNRDGSVYEYDKLCMWAPGRIIWTYSYMYNEFEKRPEWLDLARWGVDFVQEYGFAPDGRMYYALTRDGKPLQHAQDVYTELSTVIGFSEFAWATQDDALYEQARKLFLRVWERFERPGEAFQPVIADTRPVRMHGHSMITLNVLQELRRHREDPAYDAMIDQCINIMLTKHCRREKRALFELVTWDGDELPGYQGRWINPGHMIEGGTFLIHEGQHLDDKHLIAAGVELIDWGFEWGWDREFGGISNDVDSEGLPVPTVEALRYDSKLWWQHSEALYGLLLAYYVTEEDTFLAAYRKAHEYSFSRFADPEYGEWIAILDRRGNPIGMAKGTSRKSVFHIGRNFYLCYKLLSEMFGQSRLERI